MSHVIGKSTLERYTLGPLLLQPLQPLMMSAMCLGPPFDADHPAVEVAEVAGAVEEVEAEELCHPDNLQPNQPHLNQLPLLVILKTWDNSHLYLMEIVLRLMILSMRLKNISSSTKMYMDSIHPSKRLHLPLHLSKDPILQDGLKTSEHSSKD